MKEVRKRNLGVGISLLVVLIGLGSAFYAYANYLRASGDIYVVDGDTFDLKSGERIRLICVNTPEVDQVGYNEARGFLRGLIVGQNISIERQGLDKYNRTLAWVYAGGKLVNREIFEKGFGEVFEYDGTNCSLMKG